MFLAVIVFGAATVVVAFSQLLSVLALALLGAADTVTIPAAVFGGVATIALALLWMKLIPTLREGREARIVALESAYHPAGDT